MMMVYHILAIWSDNTLRVETTHASCCFVDPISPSIISTASHSTPDIPYMNRQYLTFFNRL